MDLVAHAKAEMKRAGFDDSASMLAIVERFYDTWGADGWKAERAKSDLALLLAGKSISKITDEGHARRQQAFDAREGGATFRQIADQLGVSLGRARSLYEDAVRRGNGVR